MLMRFSLRRHDNNPSQTHRHTKLNGYGPTVIGCGPRIFEASVQFLLIVYEAMHVVGQDTSKWNVSSTNVRDTASEH